MNGNPTILYTQRPETSTDRPARSPQTTTNRESSIDVDSAEGLSSSSTRTGRFVDRSRHRRRVAGTPTKTKPPSVNDLEALWRPSATQE